MYNANQCLTVILVGFFHVESIANRKVGNNTGNKLYAHQMVRTDSREQTLHAFLPPEGSGTKRFVCLS